MKLDVKAWIDKMMKVQSMSFTRADNSYVNATNFGRITGRYCGHTGVINLNLSLSANMPTNTQNVKIGTMSPIPKQDVLLEIPCQSNNSTILLTISSSTGDMVIFNLSGTATGTNWFRASIPVIV